MFEFLRNFAQALNAPANLATTAGTNDEFSLLGV
jgi:hypothetical protein